MEKRKGGMVKRKQRVENVLMIAKFKGTCYHCKIDYPVGEKIWYSFNTKLAFHWLCFEKYTKANR